jgi:predicted nucleic acid-binding protein
VRLPVLPVTRSIVERYGVVRAGLVARGIAKGDIDLLIACTALEHGATLVANDGALKDGEIRGLVVEDWLRS